jgi:hypothetical protein
MERSRFLSSRILRSFSSRVVCFSSIPENNSPGRGEGLSFSCKKGVDVDGASELPCVSESLDGVSQNRPTSLERQLAALGRHPLGAMTKSSPPGK